MSLPALVMRLAAGGVLLGCAVSAPVLAAPQEAMLPVELHEALRPGECRSRVQQEAMRQSVAAVALRKGAGPEVAAELQKAPRKFLKADARVESSGVEGSVCSGLVFVSVDEAAIERRLRSAERSCRKTVGVLVRIDMDDGSSAPVVSADLVQAKWVEFLGSAGLDIVDLSELHTDFQLLQARDACPVVERERVCGPKRVSFSEAILDMLKQINIGQASANEEHFETAQKLLRLGPGAVLLAAEFKVSPIRRGASVSVMPVSRLIESGDMAWSLEPRDAAGERRQQSEDALLLDLFSELARQISTDVLNKCAADQ